MRLTQGRKDAVKNLLSEGADVNAPTIEDLSRSLGVGFPKGLTPLILASAVREQPELLKVLLASRADPLAAPAGIGTALHAACARGHRENVDILLAHDESSFPRLRLSERVDSLGIQPLRVCGSAELVFHLLTTHSALMRAEVQRGRSASQQVALDRMCDSDEEAATAIRADAPNSRADVPVSMLCVALSRGGRADLIKALLAAGCDPSEHGRPSPHYCRRDGSAPSFAWADLRTSFWLQKFTRHVPWLGAWMAQRPSNLKRFLSFATRCTPLHLAAFEGSLDAVNALLENTRMADPRSTYHPIRFTPLHAAACNGHRAVAQRLISTGEGMPESILDSRDAHALIPSVVARREGQMQLAGYLERIRRMDRNEKASITKKRAEQQMKQLANDGSQSRATLSCAPTQRPNVAVPPGDSPTDLFA